LIGGTKFTQELGAVLNEEAAYEKSNSGHMSPMVAMAGPFQFVLGPATSGKLEAGSSKPPTHAAIRPFWGAPASDPNSTI
jgi:hypothetical protein